MKSRKSGRVAFAMLAAAILVSYKTAWSQQNGGPVGFWTVTTGGVTQDYAFTKDGKFESKMYGSKVYEVHYGTYTVQGDRITLSAPQTSPEMFRWKIVNEYGRATLKLTDSFGATASHYSDRFDHRFGNFALVPYEKAKLASFWIVNHGGLHWEYAFTADGKFQSKRIGGGMNETVRGTYQIKNNIVVLIAPGKPPQAFIWRIEIENGAHTLVLADSYGAFEIYYEAKAGE